ncbi:type IV pilus secretin PilQ [Pseudidiomarina woesei]|uniref:Type IV pilus secretin (Or competence protein) PilQ n=1 Tax=Pseudidiomarina woesei TaxID=1381080 RepID=A0A0K6H557_9GAMM|nr:type IV pilus secretin PilQ family protein [Pseudidiomarina woesei]CUA86099.1 type IV pilus secretin (or competence protein) PilQ [Pseudidiomarina woesei]
MKHLIRTFYFLLLMPLAVSANELLRVEQIALNKDRFNLEAHFSKRVESPVVQRSSNPNLHEFLLLGTKANIADGRLNLNDHPLLDYVEVEQQREDLMLRVHTKQPLEHLMSRFGEVMVLVFIASKDDQPKATTAASKPPAKKPTAKQASKPKQELTTTPTVEQQQRAEVRTETQSKPLVHATRSAVTNINFFRLSNDVGQVSIALNKDNVEHEARMKGNDLEVILYDTELPEDLLYVLDVSQFATPVAFVETFRDGRHSRIKIAGKAKFKHQLEQIDGYLRLNLMPAPQASAQEAQAKSNQKPISLNFQDVPVRQLLQILAEENNLNLVASESVTGNITLRLENVPWERALETILRVKGLDKRYDQNILIVAPASELAQREAEQLESQQRMQDLAPLESSYIQINYAKAEEIAQILRTDSSDLLSSRGAVTVDERTNTLLVRDTSEQIATVKAMVNVLDVPVKQVIIEARMVTVRDNISDELGIRWGVTEPSVDTSQPLPWGTGTSVTGDFNVNLPIASPAATIGFQVAKLADGRLLDLELSALERENKGEIIASPRITTANQKEAYIEQGTEIPYVESASSGATSVQFKKAVLGLTVTPQITPDNRVILDLVITQNTRGETVSTPTGPAVSIDTQEISTQVLVENGETIVLGGIYQQQILNDISKVPLLGDIPYVGVLFRTDSQVNEKRELLIFVTPRIVTNTP